MSTGPAIPLATLLALHEIWSGGLTFVILLGIPVIIGLPIVIVVQRARNVPLAEAFFSRRALVAIPVIWIVGLLAGISIDNRGWGGVAWVIASPGVGLYLILVLMGIVRDGGFAPGEENRIIGMCSAAFWTMMWALVVAIRARRPAEIAIHKVS